MLGVLSAKHKVLRARSPSSLFAIGYDSKGTGDAVATINSLCK